MKLSKVIHLFEATIKLSDIYNSDELDDESEAMYSYIDPDDLDKDFIVHIMTPEQAKTFTTPHNDMSVYEAYRQFATKDQKRLIKDKVTHWDSNRIVLVINKTVLDGNHHLIAGILSNKPIKYIDLADYNNINESIAFKKEMLGDKEIIRFSDEIGGKGFLRIIDGKLYIVDWQSIPDHVFKYGEEAEKFKKRGFATEVIKAIKDQLGFNEFTVAMQSNDAMAALKKLTQKGIITPDPNSERGSSGNEHYITFTIN